MKFASVRFKTNLDFAENVWSSRFYVCYGCLMRTRNAAMQWRASVWDCRGQQWGQTWLQFFPPHTTTTAHVTYVCRAARPAPLLFLIKTPRPAALWAPLYGLYVTSHMRTATLLSSSSSCCSMDISEEPQWCRRSCCVLTACFCAPAVWQ